MLPCIRTFETHWPTCRSPTRTATGATGAERRAGGRELTTHERGLVARAARVVEREREDGRALPDGRAGRLGRT